MTTHYETLNYRDVEIEVHYDQDAPNPFIDDEGNPDIIIYNSLGLTYHGDTNPSDLPNLTRAEILENSIAIRSLLGCDQLSLLGMLKSETGFVGYDTEDNAIDLVNYALKRFYDEYVLSSDKLEFLQQILGFKGVKTYYSSANGYVQGDWSNVLIVASPEFLERTGATIDTPDQLKYAVGLYSDWAYGSVFHYVIENGDDTASFGGFYGDDHEASGLLDSAREDIDNHIAYKEKFRSKITTDSIANFLGDEALDCEKLLATIEELITGEYAPDRFAQDVVDHNDDEANLAV